MAASENMTRFVVLSNARSGTSLLTATLGSHPQVMCHGEIFHRKPATHLKGSFSGLTTDEVNEIRLDEDAFVQRVFDQGGFNAVGFKMWRDQSRSCCDKLLKHEGVKKIIYERENKLAQHSSNILAKKTGVWNIPNETARSRVKRELIDFDKRWFVKFKKFQDDLFDYYRSSVVGDVLDVKFSTIASGDFSRVLAFLAVDHVDLEPKKARMHSANILSRYKPEYHDEIMETLEEIGHPEWVSE
ncbi:sulfotransferase [Paracoccus siganidrum]|uniref:sulfotransferase n=1 Tax=Paracoccus siganidrum TaxID=1276757 RepID=UPI0011C3BA0D|nr:sulfotransferase [Paracoccus siganidrum]